MAPVPEKPVVVVMVGLIGSGKSTFAREGVAGGLRFAGFVHVELDVLRLAVLGQAYHAPSEPLIWWMAEVMVRTLCLSPVKGVVVDDCHPTKASRARWFSTSWATEIVYLDRPLPDCWVSRHLNGVAEAMQDIFEPPSPLEWPRGARVHIHKGRAFDGER